MPDHAESTHSSIYAISTSTFRGSWGADLEHFVRILLIFEKREYPYGEFVTPTIGLNELNEAVTFPRNSFKLHGKEVGKVQVDGSKY